MKIVQHIINWVIWTVVGLYAFVMCVVMTPWAQRELGTQVSRLIGEKLGTKVEIGRIDLGFLNRLILDDVVIYDQQQRKMVSVVPYLIISAIHLRMMKSSRVIAWHLESRKISC